MVELVEITLDNEEVGRGLDGQEARARDINADGLVEELDGCARRRLELQVAHALHNLAEDMSIG